MACGHCIVPEVDVNDDSEKDGHEAPGQQGIEAVAKRLADLWHGAVSDSFMACEHCIVSEVDVNDDSEKDEHEAPGPSRGATLARHRSCRQTFGRSVALHGMHDDAARWQSRPLGSESKDPGSSTVTSGVEAKLGAF